MKKVLVICLTLVLMMSMTLTAFAAPGAFISSPTGNKAPTEVTFEPADDDCTGRLVITPYGDRDELPAELEELMNKAYNAIKGTTDLTTLNAALKKLAADKKIKGTDLAVSDLFDIRVEGCTQHNGHHEFDIVLAADSLKNFVGLLHMKEDGTWELIKDAKVISNGEHLAFSVDTMSPFAVVVNTGKPAQTGDNSMIGLYVAIMAISALAIVVLVIKSKKQKA